MAIKILKVDENFTFKIAYFIWKIFEKLEEAAYNPPHHYCYITSKSPQQDWKHFSGEKARSFLTLCYCWKQERKKKVQSHREEIKEQNGFISINLWYSFAGKKISFLSSFCNYILLFILFVSFLTLTLWFPRSLSSLSLFFYSFSHWWWLWLCRGCTLGTFLILTILRHR